VRCLSDLAFVHPAPLMRPLLPPRPPQIRLPRRQCLVEPPDRRRMRRGLHDLRIRPGFLGDLAHHAYEVVERLARLRFRWLDHHGLVDDQGEVDRWRVHTEVEQALGDVERAHPMPSFLSPAREHELVHAGAIVGEVEGVAEQRLEIVGIQDGRFAQRA